MMPRKRFRLLFASLALIGGMLPFEMSAAPADEAAFLSSLEGRWSGGGTVLLRIDRGPINVSCNFDSQASDTALAMRGTCRGLLVVSRSISADLRSDGTRYSGVYVGPRGGRSALSGSRRGNAINLTVTWAREVNGDRKATLIVQKLGANGMRLSTVDVDPASGKRVVTSELNLRRS
ncbi:hypothetical protein [Sinorhizobium arboris]|uniref:hypothetical protein n=1 Tax=Sinorhizobium arboris TaxID=76745 RepID=UPI0003FA61D5